MSDPLDRLRNDSADAAPDVDGIKARARRIQVRRRTALSGGAAALALVIAAGVLVARRPGDDQRRLAQPGPTVADQRAEGAGTEELRATGGDASKSGSVQAQRTAGGTTGAAAEPDPAAELEATIEVHEKTTPRDFEFTLEACNRTDRDVTRTFGDAQRYDFEVSREGEVVWRWSDGQAFAQVVGEESWGPGECKRWTEAWDGSDGSGVPVASGELRVVGLVTASPELRTGAADFCLEVC